VQSGVIAMHEHNTPNSIAAATGFIPARLVALDREAIEALAQAHLDAAHGLMGLLDRVDGDPDPEDDDPAEEAGDERDAAWIEWHAMHGRQKRGCNIAGHEDAEEDDPAGQCDEDGINTRDVWAQMLRFPAAGCEISDPGGDEHDGREPEEER